jgi:hypothetical protein
MAAPKGYAVRSAQGEGRDSDRSRDRSRSRDRERDRERLRERPPGRPLDGLRERLRRAFVSWRARTAVALAAGAGAGAGAAGAAMPSAVSSAGVALRVSHAHAAGAAHGADGIGASPPGITRDTISRRIASVSSDALVYSIFRCVTRTSCTKWFTVPGVHIFWSCSASTTPCASRSCW